MAPGGRLPLLSRKGEEVLILNNDDVSKVLDMRLCLSALESVFQELAVGDATGMGRIDLYVPSNVDSAPYYRWAVMTGGSKRDGLVCARMLSDMVAWPKEFSRIRENKYAHAPGTFCGLLFLFSARDATPVAMINDGILQHVRVGGGAGLGVKYLSKQSSQVVGMIGSGGMARTYLDAFCQVRKITKVKVYSPNKANVLKYAEEVSNRHDIEVEPAASAREAVRGADIVSICTSTNEPVFENSWLEPGMHVTNLTSADVHPNLPQVVDVAVRAGEATPRLAKTTDQVFYGRAGFLGYVAGNEQERSAVPHVDLPPEIIEMPTLIDVVGGRRGGRTTDAQTSFFLNVGAIGAQFEGVAAAVYQKAREQGLGREMPTEWFLQDVRD
jgi:alanine dehydrogenase